MIPDFAPQRPGPPGPSLGRLRLAAQLCLADELTDEEIARRLGISRRTLARWKQRPEFQAAWQRQDERFQAALAAEWLGTWLAERERPAAVRAEQEQAERRAWSVSDEEADRLVAERMTRGMF
jgi:transcriptional regulator with XRE-family HTH domain